MAIPKDVKLALNKVFRTIKENPEKLTASEGFPYFGRSDERAFTVENLETLASNHLFDDCYKDFKITELEGHTIRHYFQTGAIIYDFVEDLHKEFPDFFKTLESEDYLNDINSLRKNKN